MTRDAFEQALGAYGSDLRAWPVDLAAAAETLIATDAGARAALAATERLDALLSSAVQPLPVDAATVGRIISGINAKHEREMAVRPTGRLFAWAGGAMAVFLVAGFVLGLAIPSAPSDDDAYAALLFGPDNSIGLNSGGIL